MHYLPNIIINALFYYYLLNIIINAISICSKLLLMRLVFVQHYYSCNYYLINIINNALFGYYLSWQMRYGRNIAWEMSS